MSPRSVTVRWSTARRKPSCAASEARSGRADALDLRGDQRGDEPQQRRRGLARAAAHAQPADGRVADAQLVGPDAARVGHQRAFVRGRARRDREHGAGAVDQDQRRVERSCGRTDHVGQASAGLDGVGDRSERL